MPSKPKGQGKSGAVTRSATGKAAKGGNAIKAVTSAGKGKTSSVETKSKGQSSKARARKPLLNLAVKKGRIMLRRTNLRLQLRRLPMSWMSRMLNVRLSE